MSKKTKLLIVLTVTMFVFLVFQFESVTVPALSIKVISENDTPVEGAWVKEVWKDYSIESEDNEEVKYTNREGIAVFPKRVVRKPILLVAARVTFNVIRLWNHASFGPYGLVLSHDGEYEGAKSLFSGDPEMTNVSNQPNHITIKLKKRIDIRRGKPSE